MKIGEEDIKLIFTSLLSGALGTLIVFFVTLNNQYWQRRQENRPHVKVEEVSANLNLRNVEFTKYTKLIITDDYQEILKEAKKQGVIDDEGFAKTNFNYLNVKNVGKGNVLEAKVKISMISHSEEQLKSWSIVVDLPIIEDGEELFVPTDKMISVGASYYIDHIELFYKSNLGEKLKYENSTIHEADDRRTIIETFYRKRFLIGGYKKIYNIKGRSVSWMLLPIKKK
ncbi:hypothetical protein [Halalkalibacter oceani]|uniref:hypothetical protein n=1 Tax=Halalkalibacter oceani TaxID=1653776 RepID=UPI0033997FDE